MLSSSRKQAFGTIQYAGFQIILCQLKHRMLPFVFIQIRPVHQIMMHAQRAIHFTAAAEQATQRKVQLYGLRVDLDHLDKGLDCLILLLIEQKIQSLKIGVRQHSWIQKAIP